MEPSERARGNGLYTILLAVLSVVAFGCCAAYAIATPLLQQQDEWAHVDYDLAIFQNGGPFFVARATNAAPATTDGEYLVSALEYRRFRYDTSARLPAGYGSAAYREAFDRAAPIRTSWKPCEGCAMPYAASLYPVTAYAVDALAMLGLDRVFGPHLFEDVVILRLLHALLIVPLIVFAFLIFRLLEVPRPAALLAAGSVAFFPTTMLLMSYVQPDALVAFFTTAALYFALRRQKETLPGSSVWFLTLALACDTLVKPLYGAVAAAMLCLPFFLVRSPSRARIAASALPIVATIAMFLLATRLDIVGKIVDSSALKLEPIDRSVPALFHYATRSAVEIYSGNAFTTFWYKDGLWMSNTFVPQHLVGALRIVLGWSSLLVAACVLAWISTRLRAFAADPAIVLYAGWTAFFIAVDTYTGNTLGLVGRYWIPAMVPTVALAVSYAPRPFGNHRQAISTVFAACWFVAALGLNTCALANTFSRFYIRSSAPETNNFIVLESIADARGRSIDTLEFSQSRAETLTFRGWGIDTHRGLPGSGASIVVDGKSRPISYGKNMSLKAAGTLHDFAVQRSGFEGSLRLATLRPGVHHVGFRIVDRDGKTHEDWPHELTITVLPAPAAP